MRPIGVTEEHDPSNISSDDGDRRAAGMQRDQKSRLVKVGSCVFLGIHRLLEVPGPKNLLHS